MELPIDDELRLLALMRLCGRQGIVVGGELSLTGCDGILPGSDVTGLTTVRLLVEELARVTMRHVAAGIASGPAVGPVHDELRGELVSGSTVGPPPTHPLED